MASDKGKREEPDDATIRRELKILLAEIAKLSEREWEEWTDAHA